MGMMSSLSKANSDVVENVESYDLLSGRNSLEAL